MRRFGTTKRDETADDLSDKIADLERRVAELEAGHSIEKRNES